MNNIAITVYFVYIIKSVRTGRFYVGHTQSIEERLHEHNSGYSKSTKAGVPWELIYIEEFPDRGEAMKRELQIKKQKSKRFIEDLLNGRASRSHREGQRLDSSRKFMM